MPRLYVFKDYFCPSFKGLLSQKAKKEKRSDSIESRNLVSFVGGSENSRKSIRRREFVKEGKANGRFSGGGRARTKP